MAGEPMATTINACRGREHQRCLDEEAGEAVDDEQPAEAAKIDDKNPTIPTSGERFGRALTESSTRLNLVLHESLLKKSMS